MRVGIISDTHDQLARTARAVSRLVSEGAEALIHCGDFTSRDVVFECGGLPSYYVFGNNDFELDDLRGAMAEVGGTCLEWAGEIVLSGRRIAICHGDRPREVRRLSEARPDYLLFGHSHQPTDVREQEIRWINPGALHRAIDWTVAVLDLDRDQVRFLKIP